MNHGTILVGLVLDQYGALLASPRVSTFGAVDLEREPGLHDGVLNQIEDAIEDLDDDAVWTTNASVRPCARRSAAP